MKDFIARSMQMSYLIPDEIQRVHALETKRGYLIPNWNIQQILNAPSIKEKYRLSDESLPSHAIRIENELRFKFKPQFDGTDESSIEWIHALDWAISKKGSLIIWEYSGQNQNRGPLRSQIRDASLVD